MSPPCLSLDKGYGPKTVIGGLTFMADQNDPTHLNATEARGGTTPGMTRPILAMSLVLVIVAFALVWFLV